MCIRTAKASLKTDLQGVIFRFLRITRAEVTVRPHTGNGNTRDGFGYANNGNFQQEFWNVKWLVFDSVRGEYVATLVWIMYLVTFAHPRSISRGWGAAKWLTIWAANTKVLGSIPMVWLKYKTRNEC